MILQIKDAWFRLLEHYGSKIGNYGWRKRWINRQVGTGYLASFEIKKGDSEIPKFGGWGS